MLSLRGLNRGINEVSEAEWLCTRALPRPRALGLDSAGRQATTRRMTRTFGYHAAAVALFTAHCGTRLAWDITTRV